MKNLFLIIGLIGLSPIFAQETDIQITPENSWFKLGLTAGVPVGDASDFASFNLGADVRAQYLFNPNFAIGAASGYTHFFAKDNLDDFGIVPLAGYLRYYFTPSGLFFGSDIGYGFLTNVENDKGGLYVNPQIGYHNEDWNFYAFYQNTFAEEVNLRSAGVGITYNIRFK